MTDLSARGASPHTWAFWTIALLPLLTVISFAVFDLEGYFRAAFIAGLRGDTNVFTPSLGGYSLTLSIVSLLGFLELVAFIALAAVDWSLLRRRGVANPFHWAWSFFSLISLGGLVYVIGRTVVARNRTGRSASAPMWVWIVLTLGGIVFGIVKLALAFASFGPLIQSLGGV